MGTVSQRVMSAIGCAALGAGVLLSVCTPAQATPSSSGCAGGFFTFTTAELLPIGYNAEFLSAVDHNGDGVVCGRPLSPKQQEKFCASHECTVPIIMDFRDNDRGNL